MGKTSLHGRGEALTRLRFDAFAVVICLRLECDRASAGPLSFFSIWRAGQSLPGCFPLNSNMTGASANAAIVPAVTSGDVTVTAGNAMPSGRYEAIPALQPGVWCSRFRAVPRPQCPNAAERVRHFCDCQGLFGQLHRGAASDAIVPVALAESLKPFPGVSP